jgi:integrase
MTFSDCANHFIQAHKDAWRNHKHRAQWSATLSTYADLMMPLPVDQIDTAIVIKCLEPIWAGKTETATRVRQRIEAVLDWATARKFRAGENPARWHGHLDKLLAKPNKLKNVQHRPALPYGEVGKFMSELRAVDTHAAKALELQILTATRPGETVGAQWCEFDLASHARGGEPLHFSGRACGWLRRRCAAFPPYQLKGRVRYRLSVDCGRPV